MARRNGTKSAWSGRVIGVQPRIRLMRSFDQRHHSYLGHILRVAGTLNDAPGEFLIALGKGAHEEHRFTVDMELSGVSLPVDDPALEAAGYYRTSGIRVMGMARWDAWNMLFDIQSGAKIPT